MGLLVKYDRLNINIYLLCLQNPTKTTKNGFGILLLFLGTNLVEVDGRENNVNKILEAEKQKNEDSRKLNSLNCEGREAKEQSDLKTNVVVLKHSLQIL